MKFPHELVKWVKLIGGEGFECSEVVKALHCALENGFVRSISVFELWPCMSRIRISGI